MNYNFPIIRHIDDVLPAIEGRGEFIVAERDGFKVVNYVVAMHETFHMEGPDDVMGAIRRECRGLIFYPDGTLMSRPFHKFFNINEREETQQHVIVPMLSGDHVIMEKMDGSMIRPIDVNGRIRLATKMGVTDTSIDAEEYLVSRPDYEPIMVWLELLMKLGLTPIFEFVSPQNKIVLQYDKPDLVLLAVRQNETGAYLDNLDLTPAGLTLVPRYGKIEGNVAEYLARARLDVGREGDIVRFPDGHMMKWKNDWYVRIHKTKDLVRTEKNVVELIVNEELDDAMSLLDDADRDMCRDIEAKFWAAFAAKERYLRGRYEDAVMHLGADRKRIATEYIPKLEDKSEGSFIFSQLDGKDVRSLLLMHVIKNLGTGVKYDALKAWLGN